MTEATTTTPTTVQVSTYDVFAARQFAGNPLAVFTDCDGLTTDQMQKLAREMNLAETTFLLQDNHYRIFTTENELPFAGHPTLGTAYHAMQLTDTDSVNLKCKGGIIPVTRDDDEGCLWMDQQPPKLEERGGDVVLGDVAKALDCNVDLLDDTFPAQVYSTGGTCFLIVPVKSLAALKQLSHPGMATFEPICKKLGGIVGIYLVTREGRDDTHTVSTRAMISESAVPEDPATGSACGCFAGWAANNGYLTVAQYSVGQGHEMGRPSLLKIKVDKPPSEDATATLKVKVGGLVVPVVEGGRITLR